MLGSRYSSRFPLPATSGPAIVICPLAWTSVVPLLSGADTLAPLAMWTAHPVSSMLAYRPPAAISPALTVTVPYPYAEMSE